MSNIQLYGVYDGHAGVEAAIYTSKYLHLNLVRNHNFPDDILLALKQVLKQLDDNFCEKAKKEVWIYCYIYCWGLIISGYRGLYVELLWL